MHGKRPVLPTSDKGKVLFPFTPLSHLSFDTRDSAWELFVKVVGLFPARRLLLPEVISEMVTAMGAG